MTWNPVTLIQTSTANGDTTRPAVDMDAVDNAAIVVPGLIAFSRARLLAQSLNSAYVDDCLNPVAVAGSTKTYAASGISGRPAIVLDGTGLPPYRASLQMPPSFTIVEVFKPASLVGSGVPFLFTTSAADFQVGTATGGAVAIDVDGSVSGQGGYTSTEIMTVNAPTLLGVSADAASKTARVFLNKAVATYSVVAPVAYPAVAGSNPQPFGNYPGSNNQQLNGAWSMFAMFDRAYGQGGTSEAAFANFIAACKDHWAL
ncbi:hypothetical protein [Sphingomonas abietis]|uniref:Uncharacterized protein n=1 Tax=Sphingomonas abietis TaxID=3012344 RepID=A0ABY7NTE0_9SPHN|nr:hypothetical protein [Sphingomonas abietis]WBO23923.1 hypothetical protein PBT88_07385 [Sphingomonas abietis]